MNKEVVIVLAQLLTSMKDAARKLGNATDRGSIEEANLAKKEILRLKGEIDKLL